MHLRAEPWISLMSSSEHFSNTKHDKCCLAWYQIQAGLRVLTLGLASHVHQSHILRHKCMFALKLSG